MTIRPPQSGQTSRPAVTRTKAPVVPGTPQRQADPGAASPAAPQRDAVQISPQARQLQQSGSPVRDDAGALPPERMREILKRMSDGHYDRPEVQDAVVSRIAEEI